MTPQELRVERVAVFAAIIIVGLSGALFLSAVVAALGVL
jgi:hypothetical protein